MTPDELHSILGRLAVRRALFHSEADFQHELAWEIRTAVPDAEVRLERPFDVPERVNVDIVVRTPRASAAIELKYWPRGWSGTYGVEVFNLKNRGAQDLGRYDYWKDVHRVERLVLGGTVAWGAAVALTNDSAFWSVPGAGTMAEPFALNPGTRVPGTRAWPRRSGTTLSREAPITISRPHEVTWRTFAANPSGRDLRYLALVVGGDGA